jgi:hypothetical protein
MSAYWFVLRNGGWHFGEKLAHLSQLEGSAPLEAAPEVDRGQKVCTTGAMF